MKCYVCLILLLLLCCRAFAFPSAATIAKFNGHQFPVITNVAGLATAINAVRSSEKEGLELLLLWADRNMRPDTARFFKGGPTVNADQSIKSRMGLCDEFSYLLLAYCKASNIRAIRVEGYVKEGNAKTQGVLNETNHAWNAVWVDSTWMLCDLFWSVTELKTGDFGSYFDKRLNATYFLASPETFADTHLPVIPLFQFTSYPQSVHEFITGENTRQSELLSPFYYKDSLDRFLKLSEDARQFYIADRSYIFNPDNPNSKIATYFNKAADITGKKNLSLADMKRARQLLATIAPLIPKSTVPGILGLQAPVKQTLAYLDKRLAAGQ